VGNDLQLVRSIVADLRDAGFEPLVFGGWAEELCAMAEPRPHEDVDIVLVAPELGALDAYVSDRSEVVEKRLPQKRACLYDGVLVELFIARAEGDRYVMVFWDRLSWLWPGSAEPVVIDEFPVAPMPVLEAFRRHYDELVAAKS
jgi:hypothetical protein